MIVSTILLILLSMSSTNAQPLALGTLKWSEEFNIDGALDSSLWSYDIGNGNWGWGNGEVQDYSDSWDNVRVESGAMIINVKKSNGKFTSGRVRTNGKVEFQYGSVEARIKLPDLQNGFWPAFWMLGSNFYNVGWPQGGELDIMEAYVQ